MSLSTPTSPHIHSGSSVTGMMLRLLLALVPATIAYTVFFGWGLVLNILFATLFGVLLEIVLLRVRQRPVWPFISDGRSEERRVGKEGRSRGWPAR